MSQSIVGILSIMLKLHAKIDEMCISDSARSHLTVFLHDCNWWWNGRRVDFRSWDLGRHKKLVTAHSRRYNLVFYPEADSLKDPMFWLALSFWQTDMILSMFSGSALLAAEISFMAVYSTRGDPGQAGRPNLRARSRLYRCRILHLKPHS